MEYIKSLPKILARMSKKQGILIVIALMLLFTAIALATSSALTAS
jgi:hypothetical protein